MMFGPVFAPDVHLSNRFTLSNVSTCYSKRFSRVVGYFWVLNANLLGFRPESYEIHEGHRCHWVVKAIVFLYLKRQNIGGQ